MKNTVLLLFVFLVTVAMLWGEPRPISTAAAPVDADSGKVAVRNNAASLLADLLGNEKNLSKILIIKHEPENFSQLVKSISKAADDGHKDLDELAKSDKSLDLKALQLPPGETAVRQAISKTQEHELLSSSGAKFRLDLLLTQTDAMSYAEHLAMVAGQNSANEQEQSKFQAMQNQYGQLYQQVVDAIRGGPPAKSDEKDKGKDKDKDKN
jgi:hypothetical protein